MSARLETNDIVARTLAAMEDPYNQLANEIVDTLHRAIECHGEPWHDIEHIDKALTGQDDQQVICYALALYHEAAEHAKADGRIVIANSAGELCDAEIPRPARKPIK
jgi:hypothetical protein